MENKNILIITPIFPPDIGGPASYVSNLINKLPKEYNIKVITFSSDTEHTIEGDTHITRISIHQNAMTRQLELLSTILNHLNWADACYVQGTLTVGLATMVACKLKHKPYLIKYVGDEVWETYQTQGGVLSLDEFLRNSKTIKSKLNKTILKNAKEVITPGGYLQAILKKYYQVNAIDIPNAVDLPLDLKPSKRLPNSIVTIGRLVPWKHIDQIIDAIAKLSPSYHLTIIGSGPQMKNLKKQVKTLKLNSKVTFTGKLPKEKTLEYLTQAEYLILYSSYEGLSHTLLEAMQTKTKIIASNIPANAAVLKNGKLGRLVELNNPEQLAQTIKDKYSKDIVAKAYAHVTKTYTWDKHIKQLTKLIHE